MVNREIGRGYVIATIPEFPDVAKKVAGTLEIDFVECVYQAFQIYLGRDQNTLMDATTKEQMTFREAVVMCGEEIPRLVALFHDHEFTTKSVDCFMWVFPELIQRRKRDVARFILREVAETGSSLYSCSRLESKIPGISSIIYKLLADEPEFGMYDDKVWWIAEALLIDYSQLAQKTRLKCMRWELVKFYSAGGKEYCRSDSPKFDASHPDCNRRLLDEASDKLRSMGKLTASARMYGDFGFNDQMIKEARLAYQRCVNMNQYQEAANLAKNFGIRDKEGAAQKYLDIMCKRCKLEPHKTKEAIVWAVQFGLHVPDFIAEIHLWWHRSDLGSPFVLLQVGQPEAARKAAKIKLARTWNKETLDEVLTCFKPKHGIFNEPEMVEALAEDLGDKLGDLDSPMYTTALDKMARYDLIARIIEKAIGEYACQLPRDTIECLIAVYLPDMSSEQLKNLVRQRAIALATGGLWSDYYEIVEEWKFTDLKEEIQEILDISLA